MNPEKLEEWIMSLDEPLPGQVDRAPTPEQTEREGAAFMALMAQQGKGA